jgi:hypothetical protein
MKSFLPLLALIVFGSCTSVYKTGQTPDDVYFSPTRPQEEYVRVDNEEERYEDRRNRNLEEYREDRAIRMRVRNRRWSTLDDFDYTVAYRPIGNPFFGWSNPWNSFGYGNYYYNPGCCCAPVVVVPGRTAYSRPRTFNLNPYNGNTPQPTATNSKGLPVYNSRGSSTSAQTTNTENYRNSGSNAGGFLRTIFGSGSSRSSGSGSSESFKTGTSSSGSSSSGSSSSGGSSRAPVRKF